MDRKMPSDGRGWRTAAGSHVFSSENIISELVLPILCALTLIVLGCLAVAILVFDSLVLGWSSWGIAGVLAICGIGAYIARDTYQKTGDWRWFSGTITICVLLLIFWVTWGFEWLYSIWPYTRFARRINSWSAFNKVILQPLVAGTLYAFYALYVRLRIEIADPGHSRRYEREAQFVGAKPNWPLRGPKFPNQAYEQRIEDLEIALEEAQIERRLVQVDVTNEDAKTVDRAELPDDDNARKFYWLVSTGASFSVQTAIKAKCRSEFEKEIRPPFLDRGWAYWIDPKKPKAGMELGAGGRAVIRYLALPYSKTV